MIILIIVVIIIIETTEIDRQKEQRQILMDQELQAREMWTSLQTLRGNLNYALSELVRAGLRPSAKAGRLVAARRSSSPRVGSARAEVASSAAHRHHHPAVHASSGGVS